jgi:hypothetical protein
MPVRKWPCTRCQAPTDPLFHVQSGGLCGDCLADDAPLPLTPISRESRWPYRGRNFKPAGFWKKGSGC